MSKTQLIDQVIPGIPGNETILKQGIMHTMRLSGDTSRFVFKYAITDKGIWTLNQKMLFLKQKTTFLSYDDLDSYKLTKYGNNDCLIFYPKGGKAGNRVFFDDMKDAIEILKQYVKQLMID